MSSKIRNGCLSVESGKFHFFIPFGSRVEYIYDDGGMIKVCQTSTFQ